MAATARWPSVPQANACDENPVRARANTARCNVFMARSCCRNILQLQVEVKEGGGRFPLIRSIGNNDFVHVLRERSRRAFVPIGPGSFHLARASRARMRRARAAR